MTNAYPMVFIVDGAWKKRKGREHMLRDAAVGWVINHRGVVVDHGATRIFASTFHQAKAMMALTAVQQLSSHDLDVVIWMDSTQLIHGLANENKASKESRPVIRDNNKKIATTFNSCTVEKISYLFVITAIT